MNWLGIHTGDTIYRKIFFRVSHPFIPSIMFLGFAAVLVAWAHHAAGFSAPLIILLLTAGLFLWTLVEYVLHRFVFHWKAKKEPWSSIASGLHLAHHREPNDLALIIAPPVFSILNSALIFGILSLLTWSPPMAAILLAGIQVGYVAYEWVHYSAHAYEGHFKISSYLRHYHLAHHFKHPAAGYGVTNPLWDKVFGTSKPIR